MKLVSHNPKETKKLAAHIAAKILSAPRRNHAIIVALEGELGAGKTTFVQGFAKALGITQKIKSPTFLLIKSYTLKTKSYALLYHIDCYRIYRSNELEPLEIRSIFKDPSAIVVIEWPECIKPILPRNRIKIHIDHIDEQTRKLDVNFQRF